MSDPFTVTRIGAEFETDFGSYNSSSHGGSTRPTMPLKQGSTENSNITLSTVSSSAMGSSMHLSVDSTAFSEAPTVTSTEERSSERSSTEEDKSKKKSKKKKSKKAPSSSGRSSSSSKGSKEKASSRKKRSSVDNTKSQEDHDAVIDSMMSPEQNERPSLKAQEDDPFASCFSPNPDPATLNPFHDSFMPAKCEFGDFSDDAMDDWGDDYHAQFDRGYERASSRSELETAAGDSVMSGSSAGEETTSTSIDISQMEEMPRSQLDGGSGMNDSFSVDSELTGLTGVFEPQPSDEEEEAAKEPDVAPLAYPKEQPRAAPSESEQADKKARQASKKNQSVKFSTVESRYYERILGDNPSVMAGPPLGIGWRYRAFKPMDLNKYEQRRGQTRPSSMLIVPREERERRLAAVGVSKKEMVAAIRANVKMRNRRRQTVQNLTVQSMEESMEGASNTIKSLFGLKKKQ